MFSLFKNIQLEVELLGQKKPYEDSYDYMGVITTGRSIRLYFLDADTNEISEVSTMTDILLHVSGYLFEYQGNDNMMVLPDVTFIELGDDCCFLETKINGFDRAYRIRAIQDA